MEKRIENAIDIFLDALNNGTLAKGTCFACACGNIVAAKLGIKPIIHKNHDDYITAGNERKLGGEWILAVKDNFDVCEEIKSIGINQIKETGFTVDEFKQIEEAFESNTFINFKLYNNYSKEKVRADQIKGLEAVVKVMLTFNEDAKTDVKEVFTNKAELIAIKN